AGGLEGRLLEKKGWAVNEDVGEANSTWSSWAAIIAVIATSPSPPGRFSTTTGWPHCLLRRSASSRVPISTPLPGPSVTKNFTGRCGQVCAGDGVAETTSASAAARMKTQRSLLRIGFLWMPCDVEGGSDRKHWLVQAAGQMGLGPFLRLHPAIEQHAGGAYALCVCVARPGVGGVLEPRR